MTAFERKKPRIGDPLATATPADPFAFFGSASPGAGPRDTPSLGEVAQWLVPASMRAEMPPPPAPEYPPIRGTGYRIPIIPRREPLDPRLADAAGGLDRTAVQRQALMKRLRRGALADHAKSVEERRVNLELAERPAIADEMAGPVGLFETDKDDTDKEFEKLRDNTDPNMIVRMEANRIWAIRNGRKVIFNIAAEHQHKGDAPDWRVHKEGYFAVKEHNQVIEREAKRFGVDPDLVRAIMYIENADGHRGRFDMLFQEFGRAGSLLPMNINPKTWDGIGGVSESEFTDPEKNIRAGVALIKEIQERVVDPTPAKVGSIWQFTGRETVSDNGARVERAMQEKLWQILPKQRIPKPDAP